MSYRASRNQSVRTNLAAVSTDASNTIKPFEIEEIVPWGVQAVWQGQDNLKKGNFASDTYAFIIDSGVSDQTNDLNIIKNWSKSWVYDSSGLQSPFLDRNGHGTHIAGIVGSLANKKGIIGVAPGAQIISLKVNNDSGFGDGSSTREAVNYAVDIINQNKLDKKKCVINLSLVAYSRDPQLEAAILRAADQGVQFSIAAGNFGKDVDNYAPACIGSHPNVYVVSAVDSFNQMPWWSNFDRTDSVTDLDDVDYAAPGVNITSYYKNNELGTLSGTSQASAHVSGLLITGGVRPGIMTKSSAANISDPFAISATQSYIPTPQSTYSLVCNTIINEGQTLNINILTTNVSDNTVLYWRTSGENITVNDFNGLFDLNGSLVIDSNGKSIINLKIKEDSLTEGSEIITLQLFSDYFRTIKVAENKITVQDTSQTFQSLTLWGTNGSDTLVGGPGNDFICGVGKNGTDLISMGKGQIDILTGGAGNDVFILGDSRGTFYNDGIKNNLGVTDYALITDFKSGEDKIQIKKGQGFVQETLDGSVYLYQDLNRNGNLEKIGPNLDDLLAIVQGVSIIRNTDLILA